MHIHISNLNRQVTETDIHKILAAYPSVCHCAIYQIRNIKHKRPNTYAIVNMTDDTDVKTAVHLLNGILFGGRRIVVQEEL